MTGLKGGGFMCFSDGKSLLSGDNILLCDYTHRWETFLGRILVCASAGVYHKSAYAERGNKDQIAPGNCKRWWQVLVCLPTAVGSHAMNIPPGKVCSLQENISCHSLANLRLTGKLWSFTISEKDKWRWSESSVPDPCGVYEVASPLAQEVSSAALLREETCHKEDIFLSLSCLL